MTRARSPNYPSMSLPEAVTSLRAVFDKDRRNKMSRLTLARHLGYNSLNGRSLSKIGALRGYGLLDGGGDELRISTTGVALLTAPPESPDRKEALRNAFLSPTWFKQIYEHFEGARPSEENLRYWLITHEFTPEAADTCTSAFLDSFDLVSGGGEGYAPISSGGSSPQAEPELFDEAGALKPGVQIRMRSTGPQDRFMEHMQAKESAGLRSLGRYDFEDGGFVAISTAANVPTEEAIAMARTLLDLKERELKRRKDAEANAQYHRDVLGVEPE